MKLDAYFTPAELRNAAVAERVVVVDVLRATSTIVEALRNGARAIFPVATADGAAALAQSLGRDTTLLCGERNGLPVDGFDLGNSPAEFTPERVEGRSLVMTTTNGTAAFLVAAERFGGNDGECQILAGSFLNLGAVVDRLGNGTQAAAIVCAGREGRFALEDALLAGAVVAGLEAAGAELELNDAAASARRLFDGAEDIAAILEGTAAGRQLTGIDHAGDIAFCAERDRSDGVPTFRERTITAE